MATVLLYADDTVLCAENEEGLRLSLISCADRVV